MQTSAIAVTPEDMRRIEQTFMAEKNVPGALLMEHAAQGIVAVLHRRGARTVLFACGPGNNGGDGYAAARLWAQADGEALVADTGAESHGDAELNRLLLEDTAQETGRVTLLHLEELTSLPQCDAVVDALFGTGLSREIEDAVYLRFIRLVNRCQTPVVAVDIPSGINGRTGRVMGEAVRAAETVTFCALKAGLLLRDGPDYAGRITLHPILIPQQFVQDALEDGTELQVLLPGALEALLPPRPAVCHKGDFGRVVLLCGSVGMAGAAAFCANAAIRAGAGLTTLLCRESLVPLLQALAPGAVCTVLPERDGCLLPAAAELAREALAHADAACVGCGLGQSLDGMMLLRVFRSAQCPVVWDADALNLLARHDDLLPLKEEDVITPHPGEAARLLDMTSAEVTDDPLAALDSLHDLCGCTVLLKGARTLISDGLTTRCNLYGSPALAKGGSGDVLAGVLTALLARKRQDGERQLSSCDAAALAALAHGLAGLRAAEQKGENCVLPQELTAALRLDSRELPKGIAEKARDT